MQRILVVDDDPEILSFVKRGLAYEGYAVDTAGDGARVRIMVSPMYLKEQVLLLEVAQSLSHVDLP